MITSTAQSLSALGPAPVDAARQAFASDVRLSLSLSPRQLPSRYFYDAIGSTLFEAICQLPWYRVTRAELGLLRAHGAEILDASAPGRAAVARIAELGPGSGEKLAALLGAATSALADPALHLVDISGAALAMARHRLAAFPVPAVWCHETTYEAGLDALAGHGQMGRDVSPGTPLKRRWRRDRTLVLFLGSNIGNFDPAEADALLGRVRQALAPGDAFLLGVDLVKPERDLVLAYDDPTGVTAAFNRNLLARLNRELGADIDVQSFRHLARWNGEASRVEMHLVSTRPQRVRVPAAGLSFTMEEGDAIWTESSYKYTPGQIASRLRLAGFRMRKQWIDPDAGFALTLAIAR